MTQTAAWSPLVWFYGLSPPHHWAQAHAAELTGVPWGREALCLFVVVIVFVYHKVQVLD